MEEFIQAQPSNNAPEIETKISKSKDGQTIIIKTIITKLYSINYFRKIVDTTPIIEKNYEV